MKSSNKIFLSALIVLIASLIVYDYEVKSLLRQGNYKTPFNNYKNLHLEGFTSIKLVSSTAINIKIVQDSFRVLLEPSAEDFVKAEIKNDTLLVYAQFDDHYRGNGADFILYVACPKLTSIVSDAKYSIDADIVTDTLANENYSWRQTIMQGFKLDSFQIIEDHASNIGLVGNDFKILRATVGTSPGSASNFFLGPGNHVAQSDLDILNKSRLWITDQIDSQAINYHLADSASLIITGRANRTLKTKSIQ